MLRDPADNILAYCGDEPFRWTIWVHDLIDDFEGRRHHDVVSSALGERVAVVVDISQRGKIIRSDPDADDDLLSQLPRC